MYRLRMRGIEPLIAAIILIAITLVIAIAVVAWMLGVFGTTAGGVERLRILPNATLNTGGTLQLSIFNEGGAAAKIIEIRVGNITCSSFSPETVNPGGPTLVSATCTGNIVAGVSYTVRVLTASGNLYTTVVVATS